MNKKWKEGFSLIEVIIVLGVIAIITLQSSIIQYSIYNDDLTGLNFQDLIDAGLLTDAIPDLTISKADFSDEITISYTEDTPDASKLQTIDSQIQIINNDPSLVFKVR
jgi:prepilin-type N-terminal cleavage/methylation domain-containing protein